MVIPRFVSQGICGEPITVYGSGEQTRCFTHVSDIVDALGKLIKTPQAYGQIINIGSCDEISINALAKKINTKTGNRSEIRHISFAEAYNEEFEDMERRVPDISKIESLIDYRPTRDIDMIIDDVIEYESKR